MSENHPSDYKKVTLMVSPDGKTIYAIGGDSDSEPGEEDHYPAFEYLKERLDKGAKYDEDTKKIWELAAAVKDSAERYKQERNELLAQQQKLQLVGNFLEAFNALQQELFNHKLAESVLVEDDVNEKDGEILEERYLKAYHAQLEEDDRRYMETVYPHKNWAQEIPQCTRCSGVAVVDQDGKVHHKGHRQAPYGMLCGFHGSKQSWLDYVASITRCPVCRLEPKLMRPNVINHLYTNCGPYSGEFSSRGWLRHVEEFSVVAPPKPIKTEE